MMWLKSELFDSWKGMYCSPCSKAARFELREEKKLSGYFTKICGMTSRVSLLVVSFYFL